MFSKRIEKRMGKTEIILIAVTKKMIKIKEVEEVNEEMRWRKEIVMKTRIGNIKEGSIQNQGQSLQMGVRIEINIRMIAIEKFHLKKNMIEKRVKEIPGATMVYL